jgi:dipeptidyl-peptidase-4
LFAEKIANDHPYKPFHARHVEASFGEIKASDDQSMFYRLTPPADISGTHPTIVYVYGGPGAQKVKKEWGSLLVQMFAQQGYGVLELDNRGSANRGRFFEAPLYQNMGNSEVEDQVLGLSVLANTAWADLSRVGIFGHSYGGFMTLMSMCKAADHFKTGVAVAPVSDWAIYDTHYTERYMGLPEDNAAGYRDGNVLTHLDKLTGPLLLIHGMADDNVLFTHSTMLMSELQKRNKPFDLMTYPGAKHSMQETHVSVHRFNLILDFFNRSL